MPRYEITVKGTGIEELYEFDQFLTEDEVRKIWYQDVRDNRGEMIARTFKGSIEVEMLGDGPDGELE